VPETVKRAGLEEDYRAEFDRIAALYDRMVQAGIPAEDARFALPNATNTNFKINVNFLELLHIADLRLCTRAQWEFRKVVALMRAEIMRKLPEFARYLQPKCGEHRLGYCDESYEDWAACPIGRKRPHKKDLFDLYDSFRKGQLVEATTGNTRATAEALDAKDFQIIEDENLEADKQPEIRQDV
jgi:thymidylate synthase (FAD)